MLIVHLGFMFQRFFIAFFVWILGANLSFIHAQQEKPKVGLVLSGGGAKGYAHIGVLKVLEKAGVKIDYIGGTSIGAIVGALYASGYTADELEQIMYSLDLNSMLLNEKSRRELPFFDKTYREKYILELPFDDFRLRFPNALSSGQGTADELTFLFRHVHDVNDFNQLPIPFVCVATKLSTGETVVFHNGYLPQVVLASGAYPTLLEPVRINGELYVDGGVRNNYPVEEVRDLGADYIIGVDLQEGLLADSQLNSASKVIEQIITYNIAKKSEEQSKMVNLTIRPELKGFTATSFDNKNEIINAGINAANASFDQLKEIAKLQGNPKIEQHSHETSEYVFITDIKINGLKTFNQSFVKGKIGIITPQLTTYENLRTGIKSLYSTGNFNKVYYRITDNEQGHKTLNVFISENPTKQSIKFGLHYDDLFKTGLLINFSSRHVVFDNSVFSSDLILGDFPRYQINYFVDNGIYPSFGISSTFKRFNSKVNAANLSEDGSTTGITYDYRFKEFINQAYIQSTLFDKYAIGGGLEHQYLSIKTDNLPINNPGREIENSFFFNLYGFLKIDNLDNPNFPMNGLKINGVFKYLLNSNSVNFEKAPMLSIFVNSNKSLNNWLSISAFSKFGTYFSSHSTSSQKFILGGYAEHDFLNYSRFYGLPFFNEGGDNLLILGAKIQARILKNHYFSGFANFANVSDNIEVWHLLKYKYTGLGLGYGYDSPLGPIIGLWTYSPMTKRGMFNVSLGFWF